MRIDMPPASGSLSPFDNPAAGKKEEAEKAAKEFESMFFSILLKNMRATARPEGESNAMGMYQDMLDGEYSKNLSEHQSIGIKDMVLDWMKQNDPSLVNDPTSAGAGDASFANSATSAVTEAIAKAKKNSALSEYRTQMMQSFSRVK